MKDEHLKDAAQGVAECAQPLAFRGYRAKRLYVGIFCMLHISHTSATRHTPSLAQFYMKS